MKKHKQSIKVILLSVFVFLMLYFTLRDDLSAILQLLQQLDLRHSLFLIIASFSTCILGGIVIGMLGRKAQSDYHIYNGISNGLVSLFLMNVSASAFAKAAQIVMFKMKKISTDASCAILVIDQILYQIAYLLLSGIALIMNYDYLAAYFHQEMRIAIIGFFLGFVPILAILLLFFWPSLQRILIHLIIWGMQKLRLKIKPASIQMKLDQFCTSLHAVHTLYQKDWKLLFRVHLVNTLRLTLRHSLPLFVALALHIHINIEQIPLFFSASFFVDLILSALPVYGKHGVAETTFALVFTPIIGKINAGAMMLLWRAITFYTNTIFCGIYTIITPDINLKEVKQRSSVDSI